MTTESSSAPAELLPGYYVEESTGAWLTLPRIDWSNPWSVPSLGAGVIAAAERLLVHHLTGEPWRYTPSQRRFIWLWYAVRPDGRWVYRSGVKRGAKGTGKDPLAASLALMEAKGPVVFDGFDRDGHAVGVVPKMALVQLAANSQEQGSDLLRVANGMIGPGLREVEHVDPGILRTYVGESRIEVLTASERSSEGDPSDAIFVNETQHMTESSGGQKTAKVARRNVAKSPYGRGRVLEATNAHLPGEDSVAEESWEAWQAQVSGRTRRSDILYDSREAAPDLRLHVEDELERGIAQAYADSPWVDQERIRDDAQDPRTPPADSVRFYFNALPTNEAAWAKPRNWDARARPQRVVEDRAQIVLFLDCSKSSDATVLSGATIVDEHVMALGGWQRPHGDRGRGWLAPREEVDARVREMFDRYEVLWCGVDPSPARDDDTEAQYWGPTIDGWHRDFRDRVLLWATPGKANGNAVLFDMRMDKPGGKERNRLFTEMAELTAEAIDVDLGPGGVPVFTHDGDSMMRTHVHNARLRPNQWGTTLGKRTRSSSKLVDYAVSMVGARLGRRLVLNSGLLKSKQRSGVVW